MRLAFLSSLLSARYFPAFSLNISFKIGSTNESSAFSGNYNWVREKYSGPCLESMHSKQTSTAKCIEANCAL